MTGNKEPKLPEKSLSAVVFGVGILVLVVGIGMFVSLRIFTSLEIDKVITTTATAMGIITVGAAAVIQYRKHQVLEYQAHLDRDENYSSQLTRAIEHLGQETSISIRTGGIYELKRLAITMSSKNDQQDIADILCRYVRETGLNEKKTPYDVETAVLALSAIKAINSDIEINIEKAWLNEATLRKVNLAGAYISGAHFERTNLWQANFEGADLSDANLEWAYLRGAHLERADFSDAKLKGADLQCAHLEEIVLRDADLECVDLNYARLEYADLKGANLERADFYEAILNRTHIQETNLLNVKNLTVEQLAKAWVYNDTKIDNNLLNDFETSGHEFLIDFDKLTYEEQSYDDLPF